MASPVGGSTHPDEGERIDPWSSRQFADYQRLFDRFGIEPFDPSGLPQPQRLFRRGVVFGQRGFSYIQRAIDRKEPFAVLTGLMPSGYMHIGHKMVIDQVRYFQSLGAEVFLLVADYEAYATRGRSLADGRKIAIESYLANYIAMGLDPQRTQVYFQSSRTAVRDLALMLGTKVTWATMRAIYGFGDSTTMAHAAAPLVQVGDILHVQLERYGGPRPTLVPVGVDQDPHLRLTRDIAAAHRMVNITATADGRLGVFVRGDERITELLDAAQAALKGAGYRAFERNDPYKALYLTGVAPTPAALLELDVALMPLERAFGTFPFFPPSASYHRFQTGLTGGKMSSSIPASSVFMNDSLEEVSKKIRSAKTTGGATVEEHRAHGGKPEGCTIFEMHQYHLVDDDRALDDIARRCRSGELLCGTCKGEAAEGMVRWLKDLQERRPVALERLPEFLHEDLSGG